MRGVVAGPWRGAGAPPGPALGAGLLAAAYPDLAGAGAGAGAGAEGAEGDPGRGLSVIEAEAELGVPLDVAWGWVTAPGRSIFRSVDKLEVRRVVEEGPGPTRLVECDMTMRWRLLMLTGTFPNRCLRFEDHGKKEMRFREAPGQRSIWKRFDGCWQFEDLGPRACRVRMTQYAQPRRALPIPGGNRGLRSALRGVVAGLFEDLEGAAAGWSPPKVAPRRGLAAVGLNAIGLIALGGAPPMLT